VYPLAALIILPWVWIQIATPPAGLVSLPPVSADRQTEVYVLGYGYHTAIFFAQPPGWRLGPPGDEDAPCVEYGWGDRQWFKDGDHSPLSAVNAMLLPSDTVVYVAGHPVGPRELYPQFPVVSRTFSQAELRRLVQALEESFVRNPAGERLPPYPQNNYSGRFYPGREFYIVWHSCNHWTIEKLRLAGLPVSETGVLTQAQAFAVLKDWQPVD
jgi:hypothetical protein